MELEPLVKAIRHDSHCSQEAPMFVKKLHDAGVRSEHAYLAAAGSIGLSLVSWLTSNRREDIERADRWGIFVGEWAPTFFALGLALANYERDEAAAEVTQFPGSRHQAA
ncbi:hypothetical protein [Streptomyces sp. C8S0]|uniref:hypothetical protein n=1 Tax=Streptomyces sp. C8S0 TaxID=2585716 RepID=UPI001D047A85|nr:hypothetical protein [Streptomyces sp. C8S0]